EKTSKDAASRRLLLMSFKGMGKSIQMIRGADHNADAPAHHSDEFPAGYSLTGCSPALPVSASPAAVEYRSDLAQIRGICKRDCFENQNRLKTANTDRPGVGE